MSIVFLYKFIFKIRNRNFFSMLFEANPHGLCHLGLFVVIWLEIASNLLKRAGEEQIADFSNLI